MLRSAALAIAALLAAAPVARAEWHTLAGNNERHSRSSDELRAPGTVAWTVAFDGERVGTAVEPIVAGGRVFVATHAGGVWALDPATGKPLWRYQTLGPVLHAPAFRRALFVADAAGTITSLDPATGKPRWARAFPNDAFAASPIAYAGYRDIDFVAAGSVNGVAYGLAADTGDVRWESSIGAPVRQTMAEWRGHLYVTGEDMRVRRLDAGRGIVEWTSRPLAGQSARDYYPVRTPAGDGAGAVVAVRTAPRQAFNRRLNADLRALCAAAGIDGSDWKPVAAWTKNPQNIGTPERWETERLAVVRHLAADPSAATFHLIDPATGESARGRNGNPVVPPVLWAGGCQGVPAPPAMGGAGLDRLVVEYRTAYGNWNHGVAPLVAVGSYDPAADTVEHLNHSNGTPDAPWNTFWGTADESKHFQVVGGNLLITHQGTLTLFDSKTKKLAAIQGDRDTFGGYKQGLPWARNEWHGPARGGAAVDGNSLYWVSGSRVFRVDCNGQKGKLPETVVLKPADAPLRSAAPPDPVARGVDTLQLGQQVAELTTRDWAPFACVPGLAGTERAAAHSGEVIEALAEAFPHVQASWQPDLKTYVARLLASNPPLTDRMAFDPAKGERREDAAVDADALKPRADEPRLHPFGNVYAVKRWADRSGDAAVLQFEARVLTAQWPAAKAAFESFAETNWKLDPAKGDLYANRYLASLFAYAEWAKANEDPSADRAAVMADATAAALAAWWKRAAAEQRAMAGVDGVAQLDGFIGTGGGVFLRLVPHRHKLALFKDLTPAVLADVREREPNAPRQAWDAFVAVAPTWYLVGGERQVHYGENLYDPPDFALDAFRAAKLIGGAKAELPTYADRPWGRADVYFIHKAAMAAE